MKLSKALVAGGLAILALAGAPSRSQADVKYTVENAVFDDTANTQLTGWFTINQYGQLGNWDLTVSQGTTQGAPISNGGLVTAYEYTPATTALTNTTGCEVANSCFIFGRATYLGSLQLAFENPLGLSTDPIIGGVPGVGGNGSISWENLSYTIGGEPIRYLNTDAFVTASGVPELSTWAMMLIGFVGLGFAGYSKSQTARLARVAAR